MLWHMLSDVVSVSSVSSFKIHLDGFWCDLDLYYDGFPIMITLQSQHVAVSRHFGPRTLRHQDTSAPVPKCPGLLHCVMQPTRKTSSNVRPVIKK